MTITLTPEQQAWLKAKVERGEFPSVEDAARRLIDERMAGGSDDLAWAKPTVDEGLAAVARGDFISLDEHKARNAARLSAMKG